MDNRTLRIATRKSPLAMWQAYFVKKQLAIFHPTLKVELLPIVSKGDKILDVPLAKVGGKGLFVKELEQSMLVNEADIAVHSMKDVPVDFPEGLFLHTICERGDPRDAFVSNTYKSLNDLPLGAIVGTSSLRRECQLRASRPDIEVRFLRGNVNTRLNRLDNGEYDAIILAAAGLIRLEMSERIAEFITPEQSLPAVGQGAVGIECRIDDEWTKALLAPLEHKITRTRILAERAMNTALEGGCQVPIGSYALIEGEELWLRGLVGEPDGSKIISGERRGPLSDAELMGKSLAHELLENGAKAILKKLYHSE